MALGRPQIVTSDNAFTFWGDTPTFNSAAVASNRLSRDRRIGALEVPGRNSRADSNGFGALPPAVIGEAKRYFGPKVIKPYARNAAQQLLTVRRPRPFYIKAVVIGAGIAFGGPAVLCTPSRRGITKSRLFPPAVVTPVVTAVFTGPKTKLLPARRPVAKSHLGPMGSPAVVYDPLKVKLAYSLRGKPRSRLQPPTVVDPSIVFNGPAVLLTPSQRGVPKSRLVPPMVVTPAPFASVLVTKLAPSKRGHTMSHLGPMGQPAVVYAPVTVKLTYSVRGKPYSRLQPPTEVFPFFARPTDVTLARIRPVRTYPVLHRPTDLVDQADLGSVRIHLAYSLRGKPRSRLLPPAVVAPVLARAIDTTLVRIRPVPTYSSQKAPIVVFTAVELSGPRVALSPSSRGAPRSLLKPPTVVALPRTFKGVKAPLVRIRPALVHSILRKPIVVRGAVELSGPLTHLAYSRRGRPTYWLKLTDITIPICYGCVTGFDYASWATGSDAAALVSGSDTGGLVSGSDSAGTAQGTAAPGGNVDGGDARREGC